MRTVIAHILNITDAEPNALPLFAANILLTDLDSGMEQQAVDRARCEAWELALSIATKSPLDSTCVNPLTGKEFRVKKTDGHVEVTVYESSPGRESVIVPFTNAR